MEYLGAFQRRVYQVPAGAQHSTWDRGGGQWKAKVVEVETQKSNVYSESAGGHW
jgi:hypothetical protein